MIENAVKAALIAAGEPDLATTEIIVLDMDEFSTETINRLANMQPTDTKSLENQLHNLRLDLRNANERIRDLHGAIEFPHVATKRLATVEAELEALGKKVTLLINEKIKLQETLDPELNQLKLEEAYTIRNTLQAEYDRIAAEYKSVAVAETIVAKAAPKLEKLMAKLSNLSPETLEQFMQEAAKLLPPQC